MIRTCPQTGGCEKFVRTPQTKGAALAAPFVHPDVGTGQVSDGVSGALSLRHSGTLHWGPGNARKSH